MLNVTNEIAAIQTMVGPAGVSKIYAASSPPNADRHPIIAAIIAIDSGVRAKILALAAGIINIAIINKTPTTFIATATVMAKESVNIILSRLGFNPEAYAISSFNVLIKSADHLQYISKRTRITPSQITARSYCDTARISPNK